MDEKQLPAEPEALLRTWVERHRFSFSLREDQGKREGALLDLASNKVLRFRWNELLSVELARDDVRGGSYLRLRFRNDRSFALASLGFVFAPSFSNSGPQPSCPDTASFVDFERILVHLEHVISDEKEGFGAEALQLIMVLIAFLDGARSVGLEVEDEEQRLEQQLLRLEERGITSGV